MRLGKSLISDAHRRQRGQTMILVAVSLVSLLAMAALAIDVVSLYVASTEIQRAADAAALAGAKAMADSGITTLPTSDPAFSSGQAWTLAQSMAKAAIAAVLTAPYNQVAGVAMAPGSPTFNSNANPNGAFNDPQVTVTLQRTGLPTFFARIWGTKAASVTASATAEAYNPANMTSFTPISPKGVKPWLVANIDPNTGNPFVDVNTFAIESGAVSNPAFWLTADCMTGHHKCDLNNTPMSSSATAGAPNPEVAASPFVQYIPAYVQTTALTPANVCHLSSLENCGLGSDYQNSIQCADMNPYQCGGNASNAQWDNMDRINPNGPASTSSDTTEGVECLIHATGTGLGAGQDTINPGNWPNGPMQISPPNSATVVSTSSSIVTIPIIDVRPAYFNNPAPDVTILGFLQAFIEQIDGKNNIQIKVMNVVGCSRTPNAAPTVLGGNTSSPIPARLITSP